MKKSYVYKGSHLPTYQALSYKIDRLMVLAPRQRWQLKMTSEQKVCLGFPLKKLFWSCLSTPNRYFRLDNLKNYASEVFSIINF